MEKPLTMPLTTNQQYDHAVASCRQVFLDKTRDYGTSWRVLRIISVVDQVFIKAQRIRTIQEKKVQKIGDSIASEFMGIVNYCVIGLIQLELDSTSVEDLTVSEVETLYNKQIDRSRNLMQDKNHDYGEAWRDMSQESYVDLILVKLLRIRQILANDGKTRISEGIDANFTDMLNYAIFGLILIDEGKHQSA
jgi:hypothetical protein